MANDLGRAIDTLPGWVIPATVGGVVLIALFSQKKTRGPAYDTVVYGPQPSDPGLVGLASREVEARQSIIQTALNAFISRDISGIQSDRDIAIAHIGESVANARTAAAEGLGIVQSNNQTRVSLGQAQAAADINRTQVAGATSRAHIAAKEAGFDSVIHGVSDVISKLNPFHW